MKIILPRKDLQVAPLVQTVNFLNQEVYVKTVKLDFILFNLALQDVNLVQLGNHPLLHRISVSIV